MDDGNLENLAIGLRSEDLLDRINAARGLLKLGSGGVQILTDTVEGSKDPATINLCIETLNAIGKSAKPSCKAILRKLPHADTTVRNSSYQALKSIGSDSPKTSKFIIGVYKLLNLLI